MRLINLDDILKQFPKADFDGDDLENMKAYPYWKTDITGLFNILKSIPIIEACENYISRENALNSLIATDLKGWELAVALEAIEKLPSVTPQRPKGKWIRSWCEWQQYLECSKCGYETGLRCDTNYCPNCGADMRESEE